MIFQGKQHDNLDYENERIIEASLWFYLVHEALYSSDSGVVKDSLWIFHRSFGWMLWTFVFILIASLHQCCMNWLRSAPAKRNKKTLSRLQLSNRLFIVSAIARMTFSLSQWIGPFGQLSTVSMPVIRHDLTLISIWDIRSSHTIPQQGYAAWSQLINNPFIIIDSDQFPIQSVNQSYQPRPQEYKMSLN